MASIDIRFTESESVSDRDLELVRDKVTELMEFIRFQTGNPDMRFTANVNRIKPWS
jgi:hypothetical protein